MRLFSKEEINKGRKDQTRDLMKKNDRLASSLRKILNLQKDIDFDADKAKKVKDYQIWCEDLQKKMSKELLNLNTYKNLVEEKKEELYELVVKKDAMEDRLLDLEEEIAGLEIQVNFKRELIKHNA